MDIHTLTITKAKELLAKKEISAVELTSLYLERIKKFEPQLNALVTVTEERALEDAKKADDMLADGADKTLLGIPFTIKDNFLTQGIKTTASSNILRDFIGPYDSTVVARLKGAGIVHLGKANLDSWAHGSSTETSDFGPTKNPWDFSKLPGGSSGGSAASVAADETLASMGTETAGSIRHPAAWCGVVGLKPTYGRVSRYGLIAMASSTDSPGPITKTVEESALILEVLAGHDEFDATTATVPAKPYVSLMKEPRKMTIGIADEYFAGVDKEIVAAVESGLEILKKQGHTVKKIKLLDPQYAVDVYTILQRSEVSSNLARMDGIRFGNGRELFNEESRRRIMLGTYTLSSGSYDAFYKKAQKVRTLIIQDFAKAFEDVDVIVGPSTPVTALPLGATKNNPMFGELMDILMEPSSIAGLCGISVPAGFSSQNLPIGIQFIGPQFGEDVILNIAYSYEQQTQFWKKTNQQLQ